MTATLTRRTGPALGVPERTATRLARRLTGRPYLSHSQLSAFRACPRKFAFQYVEDAPRDFLPSSLLFGAAMHAAFESHFRARLEGRGLDVSDLMNRFLRKWQTDTSPPPPPEDTPTDALDRPLQGPGLTARPTVQATAILTPDDQGRPLPHQVATQPAQTPAAASSQARAASPSGPAAAVGKDLPPVRFNKGEDLATLLDLAERMLRTFLAAPVARPAGQIVGIEEEFHVTLADDLPDILAKVDLVTQTADGVHVVDLKTSRSRWTPDRLAEGAEQLLLYGRAISGLAREMSLPVRLHFVVVTKARQPLLQVLEVPAQADRLAAVREQVGQVWSTLQAGRFYPNPSPLNCSICPFKSRCPAFARA